MFYPFGPLDENVVEIVHLVDDAFFYHLFKAIESVHIQMEQLVVVDVEIGVCWALDVVWSDSKSLCKSLGERSLPRSEFSVQEEDFMLLSQFFSKFRHGFGGGNGVHSDARKKDKGKSLLSF